LRHMSSIPLSWKQGDIRKTVQKWVVNVLRVITALWLIVHFTLTALYVFPINPVKAPLQPLLDATIGTYFPQSWQLFAPKPVSIDSELLVRPLSDNEYSVALTKGLPSDGWYDILSPLWAKNQDNRFSMYGRLATIAFPTIQTYLKNRDNAQPIGLMTELASAFCKDIGQNNASYVALMIHRVLPRSWSERATSVPRVIQSIFVGIYPIDPTVENAHLYQI
jgi:hypothetical protein